MLRSYQIAFGARVVAVILALYAWAALARLWRLLDDRLFTDVIDEMSGIDQFMLVAGVSFTICVLVSAYLLWKGRMGGVIVLLIAAVISISALVIEHFNYDSDWKLLVYFLPLALFFAILLFVSWRSIITTGHPDEWRSAVTAEDSEIGKEA